MQKLLLVHGEDPTNDTQSADQSLLISKLKQLEKSIETLQTEVNYLDDIVGKKQQSYDNLKATLELAEVKAQCDALRVQLERERESIVELKKRSEKDRQYKIALENLNSVISKLEGVEMTKSGQLGETYEAILESRRHEDEYASAIFQYETTRLLVADVEYYVDSLDKALVAYHQEQIGMINKTIAKLWQTTYKNGDIRRIEIKADHVVEKASAKSNFNYRVVFYGPEDVELEMKGRSSMGQKVLASIVIRIALAKAFSINCGILALDEPTTNLDTANIASLAQFLSELVEQQQEAGNFQLVLITHDDQFIKRFRPFTAGYYHVHKDHDGFSKIERREFDSALL